jgi:hypothetical protein
MRAPVPAVLVALLVAAVGALLIGEQPLEGSRPLLAGVLFGVAVGEALATMARRSDPYLLAAAALVAEAGLVWGTWISTGRDLGVASGSAWVGVAVGTLAAPLWLKSAGPRGARTPDGPAPAPGG